MVRLSLLRGLLLLKAYFDIRATDYHGYLFTDDRDGAIFGPKDQETTVTSPPYLLLLLS